MRRGSTFWAAWAGSMDRRAGIAITLAAAMIIMGMAPLLTSGTADIAPAAESGPAILKMQEQGLEFDTKTGYSIPQEWRNPGTELRIVQFVSSAQGNWPAGVEKSAGRILHSIGDTVVVVRANTRQESELRALDYVQWIGPYEPRFKVFANLMEMTGDIHITAFACPDVDTSRMIAELGTLGAWEIEDTHYGAATCWIPAWKLPMVARLDSVLLIQHLPEMRTLCSASGRIVQAHDLWVNTVSNLPQNIMGQGQIVHVQDSGIDPTHRDFTSGPLGYRLTNPDSSYDTDGHGTFMTGVIAGNGYDMETYLGLSISNRIYNELAASNPAGYPDRMCFAGRAPEATIYFRAGLVSTEWSLGYTFGARIFSNSWGPAAMGNLYDSTADTFMNANSGALVLFASGSDGPRANTVNGAGNGKLALSVGAFENIRPLQGEQSDDPGQIRQSSSRGPVADGRVKPDIIEAGGNVYGPKSDDVAESYLPGLYNPLFPINADSSDAANDYMMLSGTSVAVAATSGDAILKRDYRVDVKGISNPHANLMKTLLIHGAEDMGYGYPSYDQGWGRVNVRSSICPPAPNVLQWAHSAGISSGQWDAVADGGLSTYVIDDTVPLKVTLAHWDTVGSGALTHDLDLVVTSPSGVRYEGNAFKDAWSTPIANAAAWSACAFPSWMGGAAYDWDTADDGGDDINNVEMFRVERPEKGQWTVRVVWKSYSALPFSIAMTGGFNASADVNANQYKVNMEMDRPRVVPERDDFGEAVFTCAPGGSVIVPYMISNGGTSNDTYNLAATLPAGFTLLSCTPANPANVPAAERIRGYATIGVTPAVVAGSYTLTIKATSVNDATAPIAQSQIKFQIDVQTVETPPIFKIADSQMHEDAPSMVSWSLGGLDYIACAYRKEERYGQRVYFTLSSDGGVTWSAPIPVSQPSWNPGFVGITRANSGPYVGRLMIAYNAWNPDGYGGSIGDTRCGYIKVNYADYPYTAWTEKNAFSLGEGVSSGNTYRTVNLNFVPSVNQFYLTVENFGYTDTFSYSTNALACIGKASTDGGATWGAWTRIDPAFVGVYTFFPSTDIDALGNMFLYYYSRDSSDVAQDRDLTYQYYNGAWSAMRYAWDSADNLMFPAATFAPQGVNGNRAYAAMLKGANTDGDRSLYLAWTDNPNGNPPTWVTNKGPFGPVLSDQDYGNRFLVDGEYTDEGYVWWTAMRHFNYDPYAQPNVFTVRDNDYAAAPTSTIDYITLNSYQKSKQRTTDITEGVGKLLVAWNQMTREADTDIYCALMSNAWQSATDTLGPVIEDVATDYSVCAPGTLLNLAANINDWPTGGNNILNAQYSVDYGATTVQMWESDGTFDTPAEAAYAPTQVDTTGWTGGWHSIWVRGQDSQGNWGEWAETLVLITGPSAPEPPTDPDPADGATNVPLSQQFSVYYDDYEDNTGTVRFYWANGTLFGTVFGAISKNYIATDFIALASDTAYQWYVTATDATGTTRGPSVGYWSFTTVDVTPPAPPTGLTVSYFGPTSIPTTESRYLRSDNVLGTTQSTTVIGSPSLGNNVNIYGGIRVWKVNSIGTETEITSGTAVAQVSRTAIGSGLLTNTWACPGATIEPSDSILVRVYQATTANPTILAGTWSTGPLGATQLDAGIWSVTLWLTRGGTVTASRIYWGTNTYNSNIAGFKWSVGCSPTDHNTLSWTKSADDGAGANDVVCYNIYRADNPAGPWTPSNLLAVVPLGTETYCDLYAGMADGTLWWYVVRANDTSGNEEMNEDAVPESLPGSPYNIDLSGKAVGTWAFLSFPIEVPSGHIEFILSDTAWGDGQTDWDVAKAWDNVNKRWLSYRKGGTANTLAYLDNTMGFWLHLTANGGDQMLTISPGGVPAGLVEMPLNAGWNMVGYPSLTERTVGTALWGTTADRVEVFDAESPFIKEVGSTYMMTPDQGYWVRVTSDSVWRIDDTPPAPYLDIVKTAPATVHPGDIFNYTIEITNIGTVTAYNVTVTDTYPTDISFDWSVPFPDMGDNVWFIPQIAPAQVYYINITVSLFSGAGNGFLVNLATADYEDVGGNPQATVSDTAITAIVNPFMQLTKLAPAMANPGETITYTLSYQNTGTDTAYWVSITEIYPPDVTFVSSVPFPAFGTNVWDLGSVPPGGTGMITITVEISPAAVGMITNFAYLDYWNLVGHGWRTWANATTLLSLSSGPVQNIDTGEYFSAIQTAIDDSETLAGHTIQVDAGVYQENLVVHKSLSIIGAGANITFIQGGNGTADGVRITADNVTLAGFRVQGFDSVAGQAGVRLMANGADTHDNIITGNSEGIALFGSVRNIAADLNSGAKSASSGCYEIETNADNLAIPSGNLALGNMYSDRFTYPDADAITWKWARDYPDNSTLATVTSADITAGALHLYANTPSGGTRGGSKANLRGQVNGSFDIRVRVRASGINQNEYVGMNLFQTSSNYAMWNFGWDTSLYLRAEILVNSVYTSTEIRPGSDVDFLIRITRDSNNIKMYYKADQTSDITLDTGWTLLHQAAVGTANGPMWALLHTWTSQFLPSTIEGYFYNFYVKQGNINNAHRISGAWTGQQNSLLPGDSIERIEVDYQGAGNASWIDSVEILANGTPVANYDTDITSGTSITIEEADLTNGSFTGIQGAFQMRVKLAGNSQGSVVVNSIKVLMISGTGNRVMDNMISGNALGLNVSMGSGNMIRGNNIMGNGVQALDLIGSCSWDDGYPAGGNLWSDYNGTDFYSGPGQDILGPDGIGDAPHIFYDNRDNYPLIANFTIPGRVWNMNSGEYFDDIQAAIDDADTVAGHTVIAFAGTYYEHVVISKAIRLVGEDRHTTIICANNSTDVVRITVSGVELTGFTLSDAGENEGGKDAAVEVYHVKNCYIHDNIMEHSLIGVWLKSISVADDLHAVEDNIFRWNRYGVYAEGSKGNTIRYNEIFNQSRGIYLSASGNQVLNNTVIGCDFGILMVGGGSSTIYGNTFDTNWYSVYIDSGTGNKFYQNAFLNSVEHVYASTFNIWHDGYPSGGNFWDNYPGIDQFSGPGQDIPGPDGMGDTPFLIYTGYYDSYPLMHMPGQEPPPAPIVIVSKIADRTSAMPREHITYTVFFNNTGSANASITITDTMPLNVTFVSASIPPQMISGRDMMWNFTGIAPGTHSLNITVLVDLGVQKGTMLSNMAVCQFSPSGFQTRDWANVTANWFQNPYVIYGYVRDNFGLPVNGATVHVVNNITGENLQVVTNLMGQYSTDLANLPSGYMDGDLIQLSTTNPAGGYNSTVVNTTLFGGQVDIAVVVADTTAPYHSNESPAPGGTSGNSTPVISVDVTDLQTGVDASTIRLYIQGFSVMYELDAISGGYRVSYWHEAGFTSGTVVSCRIVARDFSGNLLDFAWQFTVP